MFLRFSAEILRFVSSTVRQWHLHLRKHFTSLLFRALRLPDPLCVLDQKQQEVTEAVASVVSLPGEIAIPIGAYGQPERRLGFPEFYRTIFDQLVVAQQPEFWHGPHHVRLHREDLSALHVNPGPPFQADRKRHSVYAPHAHLARAVV